MRGEEGGGDVWGAGGLCVGWGMPATLSLRAAEPTQDRYILAALACFYRHLATSGRNALSGQVRPDFPWMFFAHLQVGTFRPWNLESP